MKQVLKQKDYEKLRSIIMIFSNQKTISIKEAMEVSGKSRTTVWRYMQILVEQKIVTAIGNTNNIVYKVNDEYL
jgi:response regulator of citrate/malate metabolism